MLGGDAESDLSRAHARELLDSAGRQVAERAEIGRKSDTGRRKRKA
jgi:hypothetical protein